MALTLFHGDGSNCCQRVKWVLGYKGISHETVDIAQFSDGQMRALTPLASVPCLEVDDLLIVESMAIVEYLEEICPTPALLPASPLARAEVRSLCEVANAYVHPGQRNRMAKFFAPEVSELKVKEMRSAWLERTLLEVEQLVRPEGPFSFGVDFTLADIFLIPLYIKFINLGANSELLPRLGRIRRACAEDARIAAAAPRDLKL
jgi:maleylacetoacetate isomerase